MAIIPEYLDGTTRPPGGSVSGPLAPVPAAIIPSAYYSFPEQFIGLSGTTWEAGDSLVQGVHNAWLNHSVLPSNNLEQLIAPVSRFDLELFRSEVYYPVINVLVANLVPNDYYVSVYVSQGNNPAVNPRDMNVTIQNGSPIYVDISGSNDAFSAGQIATVSVTGILTVNLTGINDQPPLCAMSILPLTGKPPTPTGFSVVPVTDTIIDVYIDQP